MKRFYIEAPVVLKLMIGVMAEDKEAAKEKLFDGNIVIDVKDKDDEFEFIDYEWELHEQVVKGNVYYGGINEMEIAEEESDDE